MPTINTYPLVTADDDVFALGYKSGDITDSPEGSTVRISLATLKNLLVKSDIVQAGGGKSVMNIVVTTEAEHTAMVSHDPDTLYIFEGV